MFCFNDYQFNNFIKEYNKDPKSFDNENVYNVFIKNNNKKYLQFLFEKHPDFKNCGNIMKYASEHSNIKLFIWLHKQIGLIPLSSDIYISTCKNANFDIFKYLINQKYEYPEDIMVYVCETQNLPFIKKIHNTFKIKLHKNCLIKSLRNLDIFRYLIDNNCPYDFQTVEEIYSKENDLCIEIINDTIYSGRTREYFENSIKNITDLEFKSKLEEFIKNYYLQQELEYKEDINKDLKCSIS